MKPKSTLPTIAFFLLITSSFVFSQTHFYIANRNGNNVLRYTMEGVFVEEFVKSGSGGLSFPQEVLFHPIDGSLIVTGFNNPAIKKYDGETGEYLGDFSSGYNLSRPTKMLIGNDNLLYVTQWGASQNKIVRFDLDGNFIDEWSKVNVPEGCGMTWDAAGNMYVTNWSNGQNNGTAGFVRKLDSEGNDLGIAVNSAFLQGPVGIWIGDDGDLFVVDWTLGGVLRFDNNGTYKENFISGMTRTEGNAKGPDGKYYLCDWQQNRVNRYNADGSFDKTLVNQGLSIPNSITFGPDGSTSNNAELEKEINDIVAYPNPVDEVLHLGHALESSHPADIYIRDALGKLVFHEQRDIGFHTGTIAIDVFSLAKGMYHVNLLQKDVSIKTTFVKL